MLKKKNKMNKFSFFVDLSVVNQSQSLIFDNGKPTHQGIQPSFYLRDKHQ